jgi:hypothetical protein
MNLATPPPLPDIAAMRQLVQRGESRHLRGRQEQLQKELARQLGLLHKLQAQSLQLHALLFV